MNTNEITTPVRRVARLLNKAAFSPEARHSAFLSVYTTTDGHWVGAIPYERWCTHLRSDYITADSDESPVLRWDVRHRQQFTQWEIADRWPQAETGMTVADVQHMKH